LSPQSCPARLGQTEHRETNEGVTAEAESIAR
jgi:hypothetical protein